MTIGPPIPRGATRRGRLRAGDADREHVIETLKVAFVQGRLTKDELDLRVGQTLASRTYAELATLTADIPAGSAVVLWPPKPAPVPARQARPPVKKPPNKKATAWTLVAVAHIPVAMTVVAAIIGSEGLAQAAAPMLYAYFWFVMIAVAHLVDSRLKKRSGRPVSGTVTANRAS